MDRCVVLGRGYHYATAREWALKLKELGYVLADPYSAADFLHGPLALIEAGFPALAVAPTGATAADMGAIIERLGDGARRRAARRLGRPEPCGRAAPGRSRCPRASRSG